MESSNTSLFVFMKETEDREADIVTKEMKIIIILNED